MAEKFILHVEVLFATIDDLEYHFARLNMKGACTVMLQLFDIDAEGISLRRHVPCPRGPSTLPQDCGFIHTLVTHAGDG